MLLRGMVIAPVLRGAALRAAWPGAAAEQPFDVLIEGARIRSVQASPALPEERSAGLLLPACADLHVHLDKSDTVQQTGAADGDLFSAIARISAQRAHWRADELHQRMTRALNEAHACGSRALRTHLDWIEAASPVSLEVFAQLHQAWRERVTLQCVSLTPLDAFDEPATGTTIAAALSEINRRCGDDTALMGCFVYRNPRLRERLSAVFALAKRHGLALDLHVDEGLHADATALADAAELTIEHGLQGRVTCGHACSLSVQETAQARHTLARCAQAGITLVALPTTNLYLQGRWDETPLQRGITRLREAAEAGVRICLATDNVADAFYPYGSYDLLDNFCLGVQMAHLAPPLGWIDTITVNPAQAMGLPWNGRIEPGCPADLVVLQARDDAGLLSPAGRSRRVIRHGVALPSAAGVMR